MAADASPRMTRVDVISDTHGNLSKELLAQLAGADVIVHAGDITSRADYETLRGIAPTHLCLGNNDWGYDYGPEVKKVVRFYVDDLLFCVAHYHESIVGQEFDVGVCGHTHDPFVRRHRGGTYVMNPGSTTFPRGEMGPTMGRIIIVGGKVRTATIVPLDPDWATRERHGWF
ncbi:MAG: YfcE family phosphodiesterase [Atopobiaceae bacterium]|jgi:putative phosphoesterase|nr:YfcE family phosphodiesterase [Atopobiaceae bacterium]MDD2587990.1 YfcE family phosphodiesterase [Atopobiaceae bacterium]MDD3485567.1 YfcE family phosphodiesterase [Atopobiaceae bacterium]